MLIVESNNQMIERRDEKLSNFMRSFITLSLRKFIPDDQNWIVLHLSARNRINIVDIIEFIWITDTPLASKI